MKNIFEEREKALEGHFIRQREEEIFTKWKKQREGLEMLEQLSLVSGIHNKELLQKLLDLGVRAEAFSALTLIPLVLVAWADRVMDSNEKEAILKISHGMGLSPGTPGYQLIEGQLVNRPSQELYGVWAEYLEELKKKMSPGNLNQLKLTILERCKEVAQASGGVLGMGTISESEKEVLSSLEKKFLL